VAAVVVVMSRFCVANGMEGEVERAFAERPRRVDDAPGFLGLETFVDTDDRRMFYLVTRWTDVESFRRWHGSAEHRASHHLIPRGLRLDPLFTKVWHLEKIAD
jgi:heme-degrading monooxygenase HmoA